MDQRLSLGEHQDLCIQQKIMFLNITFSDLLVKKLVNHSRIGPETPMYTRPLCHTLSNALDKSQKIIQQWLPTSMSLQWNDKFLRVYIQQNVLAKNLYDIYKIYKIDCWGKENCLNESFKNFVMQLTVILVCYLM